MVAILMLQALPGTCGDAHPAGPASDAQAAAVPADGWTGKVVETMDAGAYTYVRVDTGKQKIWAAAPKFPVKVGDKVTVPAGMPMKDFQSKSLKRTFDTIYFAGAIGTPGAEPSSKAMVNGAHPGMHGMTSSSPAVAIDFSGLKKADGGMTVAEILAAKKDSQGKRVRVRGKIVKYNPQILSRNWVHLQDGTGAPGTNDLTVTTTDAAKMGDTVLVTGTLVFSKDFGHGYKYEVLLEDAKLTVEKGAKP
jgi:hypothetical protein